MGIFEKIEGTLYAALIAAAVYVTFFDDRQLQPPEITHISAKEAATQAKARLCK